MKVEITAMKAPWPEGAKVGDVVQFAGGTVPNWALGKCKPTEAKADFKHEPAAPAEDAAVSAASADDLQAERALRQAAETEAAELKALLAKADEKAAADAVELKTLRGENKAGGEELQKALDANAALQKQLDAAKATAPATGGKKAG